MPLPVIARFSRLKVAYAVLLIGLASTAVLFIRARESIKARDQTRFARDVSDAGATIKRGISRCVDQMFNVRALFAASEDVSWNEWQTYFNRMTVRHSELGIRSLGYLEKVTPATLPEFLRHRADNGQPGFVIIPPGERPSYFTSVYLTHFDSKADVIIGLDHAVKPERFSAIQKAIDENKPALTEKAFFMARDGTHTNFGVFAYLPIYSNNVPIENAGERQAAISGIVYMTIDSQTLPALLFGNRQPEEIGIEVFDGPDLTQEKLL